VKEEVSFLGENASLSAGINKQPSVFKRAENKR